MHTYPTFKVLVVACLLLCPGLLRAQATVTVFASYNFENITDGSTFYGDSSGNGHGFLNPGWVTSTNSNLATTGGLYAFDGATGQFSWEVDSSVPSGSKWGFEILLKNPGSSDVNTAVNIFSVGSPSADGLSIRYTAVSDRIIAVVNGSSVGSSVYIASVWNSVAMVYDGINTTTLWVNYQPVVTYTGAVGDPNTDWHVFVNPGGGTTYTGLADNIRVFTYTGTFTAANLSAGGVAVPEPSAYASFAGLLALGLVGVIRLRRQRQSAA